MEKELEKVAFVNNTLMKKESKPISWDEGHKNQTSK